MKTVEPEHEITFKGVVNYPNQPRKEIVITTDAVALPELLQEFQDFLYAMGFNFKGTVDIVEEEEED